MIADRAIFDAVIHTLDPKRPNAQAIAWADGHILGVGTNDEIRDLCDARTQTLVGSGWTITPGLTDGHQHLLTGAELGRGVNFDRINDLAGVREAIARERRRVGAGAWVLGYALEYQALGEGGYRSELLDAAAGDGPMFLYAFDLHTAFVNRHTLDLAKIVGPRRFSDESIIVCDDHEMPTGELRERSAMALALQAMPAPTISQRLQWYIDTIHRQNALGITGIHQMDGSLATVATLAQLEQSESLTLRVALHYRMEPDTPDEAVDEILKVNALHGRYYRADGVKFILDGVIETGTAWLEEPDSHGDGGVSMWPDINRYAELVRRFDAAGYRIATHAIGDRAVRTVLDLYATLPAREQHHRVEHIETVPPTTVSRFSRQGVIASMQPIHLRWIRPDLSDPWSQRLGSLRCAHAMPSGDLEADGALVVLGSDWPVAPYDPRQGLAAAQLRRAPDLKGIGPIGQSRALSAIEALRGYTVNAAKAIGADDSLGMLREGYRADLVAWAADPLLAAPDELVEVPIETTIFDGRIVYEATDGVEEELR
ncbi:amidohydrolase [Ferrimicrobium sp.]|uniref:amidohydrolase n=1 Tax=Ferrimicrobium sp. TaxID=2926050 RepID=UPI002633CC65|nr:amidohydrolase [Ferrimicrobium sp.]